VLKKITRKYHVETAWRHAPILGAILLDNHDLRGSKLSGFGIQIHPEFLPAFDPIDEFAVPAP
jgi:hypothetical protein